MDIIDRLHDACRLGKSDKIPRLFGQLKKTSRFGLDNYNSLLIACKHGHPAIVQYILNKSPDIPNGRLNDAFIAACGGGRTRIAQWLLLVKLGIDIRASNDDSFWAACAGNHLATVQWLLKKNPGMGAHLDENRTFQWMCLLGHVRMARWMLSKNAQIITHLMQRGPDFTFILACQKNKIDIVKWLTAIWLNPDTVNNWLSGPNAPDIRAAVHPNLASLVESHCDRGFLQICNSSDKCDCRQVARWMITRKPSLLSEPVNGVFP